MEKEQTMESPLAITRGYGEVNDYDDGQHRDDDIGPQQQQQQHNDSRPNTSPQSYHQTPGTAEKLTFDEGAVSVASGRSYLTADDRSRTSRSRSRGYDVAEIRHQGGRRRGDEDNRSTNSRGYSNSHRNNNRRSASQSFDRYRERSQSRGRGFSQGRERSQSRGRGGVGGGLQRGGGDDSSIRSNSTGRFGGGGGGNSNNNNKRRRSRSRSQGGGGGGFDPRSPRGPSRSRGRSQSMGRTGRRRRSRSQQQQKPEWPPCFEDDGTAYVFDPRSAMFYEAESEFFYDPKSKLYYGNKRAAYFRYDDSVDPPFVVVQSTASTTTATTSGQTDENEKNGASGTGVDDVAAQGSVSNTTTDPTRTRRLLIAAASATTIDPVVVESAKPSIAIKLKMKKIGNKKKQSTEASPAASKVKKELVNIEKWTEKQAELKQGLASGTEKQPPSSSAMPSPAPRPQQQKAEEAVCAHAPLPPVKFTSKGEPICVICKRKFPTVEKLRLHEKGSELHRTNLEKLKLKKQQEEAAAAAAAAAAASNNKRKEPPDEEPSSTTTQQYEDRAQKRRDLHGPPSAGGIPSRVAGSVVITETSRRQQPNLAMDTLGQDNVGHQLLRKLGWDGGGGGSETKKSVVASASAAHAAAAVLSNRVAAAGRATGRTPKTTAADNIRKEWDVIEAKAAANARGGGGPSSRQGLSNGTSFRMAILDK